MTLEMQLFCIQEREEGKSLSQICQSVHRKFDVATSKSVVHRLLRKNKEILATTEGGSKEIKNRKEENKEEK